MKLHPAIRILLAALLTVVLCAPVVDAAGPGPAAPKAPRFDLFHPQFVELSTDASSALYLQNPSGNMARNCSVGVFLWVGRAEVRQRLHPCVTQHALCRRWTCPPCWRTVSMAWSYPQLSGWRVLCAIRRRVAPTGWSPPRTGVGHDDAALWPGLQECGKF